MKYIVTDVTRTFDVGTIFIPKDLEKMRSNEENIKFQPLGTYRLNTMMMRGDQCENGHTALYRICELAGADFDKVLKVINETADERLLPHGHQSIIGLPITVLKKGMQVQFKKGNTLRYGQDFSVYSGVPTGVTFTIGTIEPKLLWLSAKGYGNMEENGQYGNGRIALYTSNFPILDDSMVIVGQ